MKSTIYLYGLITILLAVVGFYVLQTVIHEHLHQLIYEDYGINSTVEYHFLRLKGDVGVTKAWVKEGECPEACEMAHEMNEIVGYNLNNALGFITVLFIVGYFTKAVNAVEEDKQIPDV